MDRGERKLIKFSNNTIQKTVQLLPILILLLILINTTDTTITTTTTSSDADATTDTDPNTTSGFTSLVI